YKHLVPTGSFYSKENRYINPVERKQLRENFSLGERNRDEDLPTASRTEKMNVNFSRKTNSRPSKSVLTSKSAKAVPKKLGKAKGEMPVGKPSMEKENVNILIKKKMDSPFRVLSMTVKPALKLQSGAAFFSAKKKSHSKKPVVDTKSLQDLPKSPQENHQPSPVTTTKSDLANKTKALEAGGTLQSISVPQKKENEEKENFTTCVNGEGDSAHGGTTSQKSGSSSGPICTSKSAGEGDAGAGVSTSSSRIHGGVQVMAVALLEEQMSPFGSSPPTRTSHPCQKSKKTKELCKRSRDQMIIDAGQKHFGAVVCKSCGMIYTAASPEDEAQHIQHHERFLEALRYVSWKKERVVSEFWDGKIVLILPNDPKYAVKKAEDVQEIVDNELGFKQVPLSCPAKTKTYFFVSNEKMIVGCLVAESIKQAFRVLSEPGAGPCPEQDSLQQHRAWRCSTEPEAALCGVSRIWVFGPRRRTGIARRMVDMARSTFMYGSYLSTQEIAFSDPTPAGKLFATQYCQTPNFLVYNFISNN
ncbi:ESCO2 acetyltransferase, partial [Heliornis fulica]|nr:ESCO2 acetyltransferase [Heliornis fulica]